jgi:hypothetical protein
VRLSYFLHRWVGTVVGGMVFVWFGSGIAMLYYPSPSIAESHEASTLVPTVPQIYGPSAEEP